jgi:small-conductance mechanosensitive channel
MELSKGKIKNIKNKIQPHSKVIEVDTLLPKYSEFIIEKTLSYKNFKNSHPNRQKLINIINKWGSYNAFLNNWQSIVNAYLDKNTIWLDKLEIEKKEWQLTYDKISKQQAPTEVLVKVREIRREVNTTIKMVGKQNNHYLSLENQILIEKENISAVIEDLEEWKSSKEFSLTYLRHRPIWELTESPRVSKTKVFNAWSSFEGNIKGIVSYIKSPENNVLVEIIILILMSIWLWRLKKSFRKINFNEKDVKLIQSKNVIVDHLTPSIIFTWIVVSMIYFSHTPNLLAEIFLLIALLTTIPLIGPRIHPRFKGLLIYIIILFIMNTIKAYVWYSPGFYRIYLFLETLISLIVLLKMNFPIIKTVRLKLSKLSRLVVSVSPVLFLTLLVALVSNILGYTNLTDLMLKISIKGTVLIVLLFGMLMIFGGLVRGSIHYYFSKAEQIDYQYKHFIEKRASQLVELFSGVFLVIYLLHVLDVYQVVVQWIADWLNEPIEAGVITFSLGSIFGFLAVLFGSFAITSFLARIIDGGILNFLKLPKGIPAIVSVVIRYFVLAFGFVIAMSAIGINLSQFNLMAGALGLGIGFGLQNIISNFISGLILLFERPIQTNDVVEVGTLIGTVRKIGVRSSNVRTFNGAEVVVPNSNLISNEVINWTLSDNMKRMEIKIGAAYGTDLQKVVDILTKVASANPNVLKEPQPVALFNEFGDSSLDFRLLFWVQVEIALQTKSEVSIAVYNAFVENQISIPFPQRDVNISKDDMDLISGKE